MFEDVYAELRRVMLDGGTGGVVTLDEPGSLVVRTAAIDERTGEAGWFGTVKIGRSYVAYHLMPLYVRPGLADGISAGLARRRQGKTCFNFRTVDKALFDELLALTRAANAG